MTDAHYQTFALSGPLHLWIPEHEPREKDPHYHIFNAAKKKLHQLDVGCWRCGVKPSQLKVEKSQVTDNNPFGAKQIEIHHREVEFSIANAIDVEKFKKDYPQYNITDEDSFLGWVESEGNLQCLCDICHRSPHQGIHMIPEPLWKAYRDWRKDLPAFIQDSPS